jgi:hypothetical protein
MDNNVIVLRICRIVELSLLRWLARVLLCPIATRGRGDPVLVTNLFQSNV